MSEEVDGSFIAFLSLLIEKINREYSGVYLRFLALPVAKMQRKQFHSRSALTKKAEDGQNVPDSSELMSGDLLKFMVVTC